MNSGVQPLLPSDPTAFGGWTLLGRLGKGGFSTIYLGEKGGQFAAIKMIRKELLGEANVFERFATEINNLEKISHSGVAKLIEEDLSTEVPYIAMEYVQGKTLEQNVLENGPLSESQWLDILESVSETLEYCHSLGIIHKDIGPGNIMLSNNGPKIIDFGISYEHGSSRVTQDDQIVGTPSYMSPEHLSGQVNEAMDVFSLGATFVFAGTGLEPFASDSKSQTRTSITFEMPKLDGLSQLQRELLEPLLYKKITDRPNLSELLAAIKSFRSSKNLGHYSSYHRGSSKKLVSQKVDLAQQRRVRNSYRVAIALILLTTLVIGTYSIVSRENQVNDLEISSENKVAADGRANGGTTREAEPNTVASKGSSSNFQVSSSADCEDAFLNNKNSIEKSCTEPANRGDLRSIYYLGKNASASGKKAEAEKWFLLAATKDDVSSMGELAQIYLDKKETSRYRVWVTRCANYTVKSTAGARCKLLLGIDLLNANETTKALLYLKDSVDYGNGSAATILGMHYSGLQQKDVALNWFVRAAELGDSDGLSNLIRLAYQLGRNDLYLKWLKASADDGNGEYAWMLATEYLQKEDYKSAKKYAEIGSNAGDQNAMGVLGIILYKIENNLPKAKLWLNRAAAGDNVTAINLLGLIARVEDKNYVDSINWYKRSASLGDLEAGYWLGAVYAGGLNDGASACTAFKGVITRSDELKRLGTFDAKAQTTWVTQSLDGIQETC